MIGICCHQTSRFARNTGIRRCLRATARAQAPALQEQAEAGSCMVVDTTAWQPLVHTIGLLQRQPQRLIRLRWQLGRWPLRHWRDYGSDMLGFMKSMNA
jgi:hypothetical protein